MKKVNVLMVGNAPSVNGGITSVISQLLRHDWTPEGVEMTFVPTYIAASTPAQLLFFAEAYLKIRKHLRADRPDIVHIHMSYRGSFYRKYALHRMFRQFGVADVLHLHGSEFRSWYDHASQRTRAQVQRLLRESAAVIVLGKRWETAVREIEPLANTVILSNAIPMPKTVCQWNEKRFQVLFLGVLIQRKGGMDLLHAVKLLKDADRIGALQVVIAGSGTEETALKKYVALCGMEGIVAFSGWVDREQKERLLQESQLLAVPSYHEGLPVAILEAMSYGLPIVASQVGDVPSAVREGVNGHLIQPGDITALAEAIDNIRRDRNRFEAMSTQSRRIAETDFSETTYFKQLADCYRAVGDRTE